MKLYFFNGSPRAENSNTARIMKYFTGGFLSVKGNGLEIVYIHENNIPACIEKAKEAVNICIAFPLYILSMPANVKLFLEQFPENNQRKKSMMVFIQSGFPETGQMNAMKEYFSILFSELGYDYKGIILKGYGKSVEIMPPGFSKKWLEQVYRLGQIYGRTGELEPSLIKRIGSPEKLPKLILILFRLLKLTGVLDLYTFKMLKENGRTKMESYARPLCDDHKD